MNDNNHNHRDDDHPVCPNCGKTKRSWRRLHEETLCADCEKRVEGKWVECDAPSED